MAARITYDPEKFNLDIARLKKGGQNFEVVVDPDKAISYKEGNVKNIDDVLKYEKVFSDAQRGLLAPENVFVDIFDTEDIKTICRKIIEKGEIHITAEKKKQEIEKKRKRIISQIQKYGIDVSTGLPHTPTRIEMAMKEVKYHVDEFTPVETQVKEVIKKIRPLLPIRLETKEILVQVSSEYAHTVYGYVQKCAKMIRSNWGADKSWDGVVEIPGGMEEEFHERLNSLTQGSAFTKLQNEHK